MALHSTAILGQNVFLPMSVDIEEFVVLRKGVKIGERTTIKVGSIIATNVKIGSDCFIGAGVVTLHTDINGVSNPPIIGDRVFIGGGVTIMPGAVIEDDVIIGAGTVVLGKTYTKGTYVGNPARNIK